MNEEVLVDKLNKIEEHNSNLLGLEEIINKVVEAAIESDKIAARLLSQVRTLRRLIRSSEESELSIKELLNPPSEEEDEDEEDPDARLDEAIDALASKVARLKM